MHHIVNHMVHFHSVCSNIHVIQEKNNQHFRKNVSTTAIIYLCQHLQFIYSTYNHINSEDYYTYQETRY